MKTELGITINVLSKMRKHDNEEYIYIYIKYFRNGMIMIRKS